MAETLSQYQIPAFTTPQNGQPGDADQVRGNDNTIRGSFNNHDADTGIHLQSSALASRPAAGIGGRKWFTSDGLRLYYDNGSTWQEAAYLPLAGGTATGAIVAQSGLTVQGSFSVTPAIVSTGDMTLQSLGTFVVLDASLISGSIVFKTFSTARWTIDASGNFLAGSDGTADIGGSGANRPNFVRAKTGFSVGANQVLGSRDTGWTAMTGSSDKATAFATSTVTLAQLAGRVMAIQAALTTHGIIGA